MAFTFDSMSYNLCSCHKRKDMFADIPNAFKFVKLSKAGVMFIAVLPLAPVLSQFSFRDCSLVRFHQF